MLQVAVIGLGAFGIRMVEELSAVGSELIIVDKDPEKIEVYKSKAKASYITDVINKEAFMKIIPQNIDAAILDFSNKLEPSILATHYLHQMGIKNIVVEASSDTNGELLTMAGATRIVYPELEAAQKITPLLLSKQLFNFIQLSSDFVIAEVDILDELEGTSLRNCGIRSDYGLNVIACRDPGETEFVPVSDPDFVFSKDCNILVSGNKQSIENYIYKEMKKKETNSNRVLVDRFLKRRK